MKRLLSCMLLAAAVTTSCNKFDDYSNGATHYAYATVTAIDEDVAITSWDNLYLETDNDKTIFVENNRSGVELASIKEGERIIAGMRLHKDRDGDYDFYSDLYEVIRVIEGSKAIVNITPESDAIANNQLSYISTEAALTFGHLNLLVGFMSENPDDVEFVLVENNINPVGDDNYLGFELRFNRASNESIGPEYEKYVSFNMEEYKEKLDDKVGIKLRIKTLKSGTTEIIVKKDNLFPEK